MNFITFEQFSECIYKNIYKIPRDIDLIIGIPRSGTLAANLLALYINLPYTDINSFMSRMPLKSGNTRKCRSWIGSIEEAKHILVVDDSISSGRAMKEAKCLISDSDFHGKVTYMAVYALSISCHMVDIYFSICEQPRMFEWNYMHHWALQYMCMDIDGVICEDPKFRENDDGKRYHHFLKNAVPKIIPTQNVGKLVTARLEKYRSETEEWLRDNKVSYGDLVMMPQKSAQERMRAGNHAEFKAEIYKNSDSILFIESDYAQAVEICRISQKPVFCVGNKSMINPDNILSHINIIKNDWKITGKRVIRKILGKVNYV